MAQKQRVRARNRFPLVGTRDENNLLMQGRVEHVGSFILVSRFMVCYANPFDVENE